MLPTFRDGAREALEAARDAEDAGLHGVFAYDHLWPMGEPGRPAISPYPLLGAVAELTSRIRVGTLVARVGLVPDEDVVAELATLDELSGGRLTAGVGTGDRKSAAENLAFGVPMAPVAERQASLRTVVAALAGAGREIWVGGGLPSTNAIARETGATLNLWGAAPEQVAAHVADGPVSWGGGWPKDPGGPPRRLEALAAAGATWAVFTWPGSVAAIVGAAEAVGISLD